MPGVRPAAKGQRPPGPWDLVVTDIDGTLTDRSRRLDPAAVTAVRRLGDRGIPVVLATGNVLPIALALHRSLGLGGPIVAENGGLVWWKDRRGVDRVERLADRRRALAAFGRLVRAGLPVRRLFTDRWRESEVGLEPTVSVAAIRRVLEDPSIRVESTGYAIHLMAGSGGKRSALDHVLPPWGHSLGRAVALGDGDNDVEMLRAAGFGVSFPSGSARARAAADYVTREPFARGFVEGLKASHLVR